MTFITNNELIILILGARLRKISGNLSENSSNHGQLRYYGHQQHQQDQHQDQRVVLLPSERRLPCAVYSVIPFAKHKINR